MTTPTPVPIAMPRLSDSMEEATISQWLKAPGDRVSRGEPLVEIETDKATVVYEAEADGVLGDLLVAEGEAAALGAVIATLLVEGGNGSSPAAAGDSGSKAPPAPAPAPPAAAAPTSPRRPRGERPRATPVARRLAADRGVDLRALSGSGPNGRIVRADVEAAAAVEPAAPAVGPGDRRFELSTTQRTIARRMVASRTEIPEFTLNREIDVTAALEMRRQLAEAGMRTSVNDLVVRATAIALREQPIANSSWGGDHVVRHGQVNVGIAVAAEGALLVPVLRDADRKSLPEIAAEARALGERARDRAASPAELSGATFTVTNLGMFGVRGFTAVIDAPQVAILAVGAVRRLPRFGPDDAIEARELMEVALSCDHRVVYGADGARFLQRLAELLESPTLLLLPPRAAADQGETE